MNSMFYIGFGTGLFLGVALAILFFILKLKDAFDYGEKMGAIVKNVTDWMETNKEDKEDGTIREGSDKDSKGRTPGLGN